MCKEIAYGTKYEKLLIWEQFMLRVMLWTQLIHISLHLSLEQSSNDIHKFEAGRGESTFMGGGAQAHPKIFKNCIFVLKNFYFYS